MVSSPRPATSPSGDPGRFVWSGSARNGWMPLVLVIVLGHYAVASVLLGKMHGVSPYLNAAHLLVLALLELFSTIEVQIDSRQIVIRYGYLGWLRQRIALERVLAARAFQLEPLQHGGWGYRGSLRFGGRAALVVRAGDALGLELAGGKRLSITIDGAEAAARAVNALVSASPTPPQRPK
jgi:hypothetical protein